MGMKVGGCLGKGVVLEKLAVIKAGFPSDETFGQDLRHELKFRVRKDIVEIPKIHPVSVQALEQSVKYRRDIGCAEACCGEEQCQRKEYSKKEPFHQLSGLPPRADVSLANIF